MPTDTDGLISDEMVARARNAYRNALAPMNTIRITTDDAVAMRAALTAALASRAEPVAVKALPFVVQYRRKNEGIQWIDMAAFDVEGAAERYCQSCASGSSPWEYRVRSGPASPVPASPAEPVRVKEEGPAIKTFRRIFHTTRFTADVRFEAELIAAVLAEIKDISASHTGEAAEGWRSMDSAPRDGTMVDLWSDMWGRVTNCRYDKGKWWRDRSGYEEYEFDPTYWMPLPASPSSGRAGG